MATFISFILVTLSCFTISATAKSIGFSVDLINRDSPKSPLYNPQETYRQRMVNAFRRSVGRLCHFSPTTSVSPKEVESEIVNSGGAFLMSIFIGTPAMPIHAIADTGSDLIWTQCEPCSNCYEQVDPLFDPKRSSTYKDLTCASTQCQSLDQSSCVSGTCTYSYSYGDQSHTRGNLAVETIGLNSTNGITISFPSRAFGCGHDNGGTFGKQTSGIIGLGGGPFSLIRQLGTLIGGKFSYCLIPFGSKTDKSSTLNFGDKAVVSGQGVQSTPLTAKDPNTFYFLTLEAISVNNQRVEFLGSSFGTGDGNIIIDSGTTLTFMPQDFFHKLATAIVNIVIGEKVRDPTGFLSLCYSAKSRLNLPRITAHFKGANVMLDPSTTFLQVSDDAVCFAFTPSDKVAIFGNLAQSNLLVGYNLQDQTVSFKPFDCTKA